MPPLWSFLDSGPASPPPELQVLLLRLGEAFALGCVAACVYWFTTREKPGNVRPMLATMILLSILIAMVTIVINDQAARAFSLVGALAIVRFRTIVEDTRDTAFVIYAVGVGMAAGVGYPEAAVLATPLVLLAAWVLRPLAQQPEQREAVLVLRLGAGQSPQGLLTELLARHLTSHRLTGLATARGGAALDVTYAVQMPSPEASVALVAELSRLEGVQGVELKGG